VETASSDGPGSYSDTLGAMAGVEYGNVGGESLIGDQK
jgi:hypothetical protein